ncbi:alpha/beta hydrolase family protein [Winogradskyella bathintestinalis]|jgi:alpha/beta superfamily hydrolase|uniref:Alpha/beta fold hydrolase n=1 Tax=Winogradskyella bathintestinalis TaxID=3035208 RepID=A0ABT7ZUU7_9FLAO|nr:alpha/beta fold hydrolase [Winogradskyella bathintestinalis]MDN3492748.1 alpha/beta fold hydrolase [Winogradskyella bathintestinalis]
MKTLTIIILLNLLAITSARSQDISGHWNGTTKRGDKEITFVFNIKQENATYSTTMDVPTFRIAGIKPSATTFTNGKLIIDGSNVGMNYTGVFNTEAQQFEGIYKEGGIEMVLNLKKGTIKIEDSKRPQEPVKPYPYYEEEVIFKNNEANITLAGTLTLPNKNGKFPVVILISGSGPQDRDESFMGHKPFLVLSDYLTRQGIGVLRFDDRGVGESTGNFGKATTEDFSKDVLSAIAYLKTRNDVDIKNIGLIGHSEGGIIAPLAANNSKDVAFMVLLASTGISGTELSVMQSKTLREFPVKDEVAYEKNTRKAIAIVISNKSKTEIKIELTTHYNEFLRPILTSLNVPEKNINAFIENQLKTSLQPWSRYFLQYNPADEIEKLQIPVLSLNGSKDTQVNAKINQEAIRQALIKGQNKNYKIVELENLNHFFQECETGKMDEYRKIEQTFSPTALNEIKKWVIEHLK